MSKSFVRSIKNVANGYSTVQILVRKATSNDATGPTTYDMEEVSSYSYQSQTDFLEIMDMLDRRLNDKGKNWRHVAKSLTVLDYLVRFGSEKCVMWAKDNLYIIKTLREFVHFDEANNDQGAIIRVKAKELVSLLRDDDRLRHERELATKRDGRGSNSRDKRSKPATRNNDPYDDELQQALELSRLTADQENQTRGHEQETRDPDLEAALKLSLEEDEMRRLKNQQNDNLLDLDDGPSYYQPQQQQPQYYMSTGYYQQQQPQQFQQYDMFGNPIQSAMATGYYQQPQQPQFTGFNYQPQQVQQPQQELQPLKTGSNNPFALGSPQPQQQPQSQSLNDMAHQQQQQQPQFFTQPTQQPTQQQPQELQPQNTSSSKYGDHSHPDLNNLLAQGTGIDTFGNTGDMRVSHHYTKGASFLTSSGTGIQQTDKALYADTGNPFIPQQTGQPTSQQAPQQQPAYTGYGFGNVPNSNPNQRSDNGGPSLIDI